MSPSGVLATPVFGRGAGLGNRLFAWARCRVFCHETGARTVSPRWWRPALGHLLRGTVSPERFLGQIALAGLFRTAPGELPWRAGLLPRLRGRIVRERDLPSVGSLPPGSLVVFDGLDCSFRTLNPHREGLAQDLVAMTRPRHVHRAFAIPEPVIGINVRCGRDFRPPPEQGAAGDWVGWLQRTPIEWFVETLQLVRERAGTVAPALVISDGTAEQLRPLLELPAVSLLRPTNAIVDLLALARCRLLLGSGSSTFSAWAAFLGQQTAITAPGHPLTNWGLQPQEGRPITTFHPRRPDEDVLGSMMCALQDCSRCTY